VGYARTVCDSLSNNFVLYRDATYSPYAPSKNKRNHKLQLKTNQQLPYCRFRFFIDLQSIRTRSKALQSVHVYRDAPRDTPDTVAVLRFFFGEAGLFIRNIENFEGNNCMLLFFARRRTRKSWSKRSADGGRFRRAGTRLAKRWTHSHKIRLISCI
jgi:hypothetical protein